MANVSPGFVWTATTPLTATNLNLAAQPSVSLGTNEIVNSNLPALASNNILLGRATTGAGNYEAIDLTTTGLGYYVGAGGTVTQSTNKSTAVTLSKMTGTITMNNAALNATTAVGFTVTNTLVAATDVPHVVIKSGATADSYTVTVDAVAAGSFRISVRNFTGGNLSEAIVLSVIVFKGVAS